MTDRNKLKHLSNGSWWTKVAVSDGCWQWVGRITEKGYGRIQVGGIGGASKRAHRVVYEALVGPIPTGKQLDHTCRNRSCVSPEHLRPVSHQENQTAPGSQSFVKKYKPAHYRRAKWVENTVSRGTLWSREKHDGAG